MSLERAQSFLDAIFRDELADGRKLCIWTLADKASKFFDDTAGAARWSIEASQASDVYFGVGVGAGVPVATEKTRFPRFAETDIVSLPALWADIDVAGVGHKPGKKVLPPSFDEARKILDRVGVAPSIIINSGHGLQAYWLLADPIIADDEVSRRKMKAFSRRWHATIRAVAQSAGYTIDSVFDLARVMRVPGTMNRKKDPLPVTIELMDLKRYLSADDLDVVMVAEELMPAIDADGGLSIDTGATVKVDAVTLTTGASAPSDKLDLALENDPKFKKTWTMARKDLADQSASSYDMALANWGVSIGWSDQDIANLIIHFRRKHKLDLVKAMRRDYIMRTLARVKSTRKSDAAVQELVQNAPVNPLPPDQVDDEMRDGALKRLSAAFGVDVIRFIQYSTENSTYYVVLADGREIRIGAISAVLNPDKFREPLIDATQKFVPTFKRDSWRPIVQVLLSIVEKVENLEAHDGIRCQKWITTYLARETIYTGGEWAEALERGKPFIREGSLWIQADTLRRHMKMRQDEPIEPVAMYHHLRRAGFTPKTVSGNIGDKRTSRYYWRAAIDDAAKLLPAPILKTLGVSGGDGPADDDSEEGGERSPPF